jgi:hypothetical protein
MAGLLKPFALLLALAAGALASAQGPRPAAFAFGGVINRFVTPNGDGRNDSAVFRFENPRDAGGTLKVYDLRGHKVADVEIQPTTSVVSSVSWTPSTTIPSGVYIYVIQVESKVVSGAVVVVR